MIDLPESFRIETRRHDGQWLVAAFGELDLATVGTLESELDSLSKPVVLDLRRVTFVDATGLKVLLRATRDGVSVSGVSSEVRRLLRICGLDRAVRYPGPHEDSGGRTPTSDALQTSA